MADPRPISRRRCPGSEVELSSLAIALDPVASHRPGSAEVSARVLRQAWEAGVTTFDLSQTRSPLAAEALYASAFPDPDPRRVVLLGRGPGRPGPRAPGPRTSSAPAVSEEDDLAGSLEESQRRLGLGTPPILVWHPGPDIGGIPPDLGPHLRGLRDRRVLSGWAIAVDPASPLPSPPDGSLPFDLLVGPLSLLDRRLVGPLEAWAARRPVGLVATDPFAHGLLDGSRIAAPPVDRNLRAAPDRLRSLEEEFAPVLRLGFLTESRRRTLAEAALLYDLHWPWVSTVVLPLPAPERLTRLLAVEALDPLSELELARLAVP